MVGGAAHGRLVGRDAELGLLAGAVSAVAGGALRAVTVHGDPGIGKTRLLAELAGVARRGGFAVHHGQATEFEHDVPFGVYLAAFEPQPGEPGQGVRGALTGLLRDATGTASGAAHDGRVGLDRYRLFQQARLLLEREGADEPVAVVLDDLHWADQSSLQLTEFLLRHPPRAPFLLAIGYRTAQVPSGVARAAAQLGDAAVSIGLPPLRESDLAALLPYVDPGRRRLLHRTAHGNPLYLQVLADAGAETLAALAEAGDTTAGPPERVLLEVLSTELTALTPEIRQVASAAAVAGEPISLDLLGAITHLGDAELDRAIDHLVRVGTMAEAGALVRFRHPLVRAAAYWMAGAAWRSRAHARAAAHLRTHGGPLQLLAHHTGRSAKHGDLQAVQTLHKAATAARHAAPSTAVQLLRTALRLLPDGPDTAHERVRLQWALGRALGVTGDLTASRRLLHEVMQAPGPLRIAAVSFSSLVYRLLGDFDEARALLVTELGRPEPDRLSERDRPAPHDRPTPHDRPAAQERPAALALVGLAAVELMGSDPAKARTVANDAVRMLTPDDDRALEAAARAIHALTCLRDNRVRESREEIDRAAWLMDAVTDDALAPHIELVAPLAWAELQLEAYGAADRHVRRGLDVAYRHGRSHAVPYLLIVVSALHARQGRPQEAVAAAEEAREASRLIHSAETLAMSSILLLRPLLWRQGPAAALALTDQSTTAARPRSRWWAGLARLDLAQVYAAAGQTDRALAELSEPAGQDGLITVYQRALQATVLDGGEASRLAGQALALARESGLPYQLGYAHRAKAKVLASDDQVADAAVHAADAARHFADAGAPIEEALTRQVAADLHARLGDAVQAQEEIGRAKMLYAAAGATWLSAELARHERRLAALAPRGGQRPGGPLATLTAREQQIADLVVDGLTNQQIAERLYLSRKTVEAHLSRAFAKLGVQSRVGLTLRLATKDRSRDG